jgi:hypothetical protein
MTPRMAISSSLVLIQYGVVIPQLCPWHLQDRICSWIYYPRVDRLIIANHLASTSSFGIGGTTRILAPRSSGLVFRLHRLHGSRKKFIQILKPHDDPPAFPVQVYESRRHSELLLSRSRPNPDEMRQWQNCMLTKDPTFHSRGAWTMATTDGSSPYLSQGPQPITIVTHSKAGA